MVNPVLSTAQLEQADALLAAIRADLERLSGGDADLLFAYRRKIAKMLVYDERSGPMVRRRLKREKLRDQGGRCAICERDLPPTYNVLDRFHAPDGYTIENTRLICETCDRLVQAQRRYR